MSTTKSKRKRSGTSLVDVAATIAAQAKADERRAEDAKFRDACAIVERHARSIGKDCQIVFARDFVEVAPLSWSGSVTAPTLHAALVEAWEEADG